MISTVFSVYTSIYSVWCENSVYCVYTVYTVFSAIIESVVSNI